MCVLTQTPRRGGVRRTIPIVVIALTLLCLPTGILFAQTAPTPLSIKQAVSEALSHSSNVESAVAAWESARQKVLQAKLNMLPSVNLTGSYLRLSELPSSDTTLTIPLPSPPLGPGPLSISLPTQQDAFSFGVSVKYPVFTGFRLLQAAKIAALQSKSKKLAIQIVRNALTFEVERIYWESVRASAGVTVTKKNLNLVHVLVQQVKEEVDQGLATPSDLLTAEEHYNQAQMALSDAVSGRDQAYLALASLLGQDQTAALLANSGAAGFQADAQAPYALSAKPSVSQFPQFNGPLRAAALVDEALADRPELQTAAVGVETAKHAADAAKGALSPTLALIGDYTYANPNQRVLFSTSSAFTGTWDVGVAVNIDVGKLPAEGVGAKAANLEISAARAQAEAERIKVVLDVRKSLLAFEQDRQDLSMTSNMVKPADENLRVVQQKYANGMAKRSDVLQAELAQLRAQFAVTNKEIDIQIAAADLARAIGLNVAGG